MRFGFRSLSELCSAVLHLVVRTAAGVGWRTIGSVALIVVLLAVREGWVLTPPP